MMEQGFLYTNEANNLISCDIFSYLTWHLYLIENTLLLTTVKLWNLVHAYHRYFFISLEEK